MSSMEIANTYFQLQADLTAVTNIKSHLKRCSRNLIFNVLEFSVAYAIICGTALHYISPYRLMVGYILLLTALKTLHCVFTSYDDKVLKRITTMNSMYDEKKHEELRNIMSDSINIIQRYVLLCFAIQAFYYITFTLAIVSLGCTIFNII